MTDREEYKSQYPDRVNVFKNGVEVGWFKNIESGVNAIEASCFVHDYNIADYELRSPFDDAVVWRKIN